MIGGMEDQRQLVEVSVTVRCRLDKSSEAPVVTPGESINITTDMLDASRLAWLTGGLQAVVYYKV